MKTNFPLLTAIKEKGLTQRDFARIIGENEGTVSKIINGVQNPDPTRKIRYAKALHRKIEEIFPDENPH